MSFLVENLATSLSLLLLSVNSLFQFSLVIVMIENQELIYYTILCAISDTVTILCILTSGYAFYVTKEFYVAAL